MRLDARPLRGSPSSCCWRSAVQLARIPSWGLAEKTYAELVDKLAKKHFAGVPPALRADIRHYDTPARDRALNRGDRKQEQKARRQVGTMLASVTR